MQVCSVPGCRPRENVVGEQLCRRHINVACAIPNNAALIGIPHSRRRSEVARVLVLRGKEAGYILALGYSRKTAVMCNTNTVVQLCTFMGVVFVFYFLEGGTDLSQGYSRKRCDRQGTPCLAKF